MKIGTPPGAARPLSTGTVSESAATGVQPDQARLAQQEPPVPRAGAERLGGGLAPARLLAEIARAEQAIDAILGDGMPPDIHVLVDRYSLLGHASSRAQAVLLSALDALDPKTGGGVAHPPDAFRSLRAQAMAALRRAGEGFAHLEPAYGELVHGGGGWPNQPVLAAEDRGDGRPLNHYRNTFKQAHTLTHEEQHAEYQKRVDTFLAAGGSFEEDIAILDAGHLETLVHRERYDYVMSTRGVTRVGTTTGNAKPGHSLLAVGGPELEDDPVLLAGAMGARRDSAGDLEVLLVANNSGHFKPSFEDLDNALDVLEQLGVPREKVVLFGGPNNLPAMFSEIGQNKGLGDLGDRLPPSPRELLEQWRAPGTSPLHVRS